MILIERQALTLHRRPVFRHLAFFCALLLAASLSLPVCALPVTDASWLSTDAYVVMDAGTGQLLASHNPDKIKYPASITKILTLALTLQYGSMEDTITVSDTAVQIDPGSTHIWLQPGEVITVRDAVMATLLASANDAANCLAEYVSGSEEAFAALMDQTLEEIGCTSTHFVNASGLPDPAHVTTARDMARLTAWALGVEGFREVFATDYYTMPATNLQPEERSWGTQNAMFVESKFYYEGAWGGKLGWTEDARHTMVTTLTEKGRDLILVTLDTQQKYQKYWDGIFILDTCLAALEPVVLDTLPQAAAAQTVTWQGEALGEVRYIPQGAAVWLPVGADGSDVKLDWQLPAADAGEALPAVLTVTVPAAAGVEAQTLTLSVPPVDDTAVQAAFAALQAGQMTQQSSADVPPRTTAVRRPSPAAGAIPAAAVLVLAAFCVRWVNLARRRAARRRAARARKKRQTAAPQQSVTVRVGYRPPHTDRKMVFDKNGDKLS